MLSTYVSVFLVVSFLLGFLPITYTRSSSPHSCHMPHPSHPPRLYNCNYSWRNFKITAKMNVTGLNLLDEEHKVELRNVYEILVHSLQSRGNKDSSRPILEGRIAEVASEGDEWTQLARRVLTGGLVARSVADRLASRAHQRTS
jgi:hypothetical protein